MYIDYEVADRIATITLNRPEAANAQNPELLDELDAAWTRAAEDNDVSVIVLRANGKHFSAGHDLRGGGPVPDKITLDFIIQHEAKRYLEYTLRWRNVPKPSGVTTLLANCLAHRRRQIVEVAENFPEACRNVLEMLAALITTTGWRVNGNCRRKIGCAF